MIMKDLFQISVECHSGYKADEYPKCFYWDNIRFEIAEIPDRWYQGDSNPEFPAANYYKVITKDRKTYILKHEIQSDTWFLWIKGETLNI
jgi:hypothetical protein